MFTSYVFAELDGVERIEILEDPGILNFVFWLREPATLTNEEVNAIREIESKGQDIKIENEIPKKGENMHIQDGPFKGLNGQVDHVDQNKMILLIEKLGIKIRFNYYSKVER